jgi:hypothetical protein
MFSNQFRNVPAVSFTSTRHVRGERLLYDEETMFVEELLTQRTWVQAQNNPTCAA